MRCFYYYLQYGNRYFISNQNDLKNISFGAAVAAHTYIAHVMEYPSLLEIRVTCTANKTIIY